MATAGLSAEEHLPQHVLASSRVHADSCPSLKNLEIYRE